MNTEDFLAAAGTKGFDTIAALNMDEVRAALDGWQTHLDEKRSSYNLVPVDSYLITDPHSILPGAKTLLMFAFPYRTYKDYPKGTGTVSGYYIASNKAYHKISELIAYLHEEDIQAVRAERLPQKPLAYAAGLGRYGRNGMIVRSASANPQAPGTQIVISSILTDTGINLPAVTTPVPDCESCGQCEISCPTGCLKDGFVQTDRCLRMYMTYNKDIIPDDLRALKGDRLLGCDECSNACPGMEQDPAPKEFGKLFAWDILNDPDKSALNFDSVAALIGKNYAQQIRNL